jgi:tRNA pseudouridine13 synthase
MQSLHWKAMEESSGQGEVSLLMPHSKRRKLNDSSDANDTHKTNPDDPTDADHTHPSATNPDSVIGVSAVVGEIPAAASREVAVGISAFLRPDPQFSLRGSFKARITDFAVNEIGMDGHVVELTDGESLPAPDAPPPDSDSLSVSSWDELVPQLSLPPTLTLEMQSLVSGSRQQSSEILIDVSHLDKNGRRLLHQSIRKFWTDLSSVTRDNLIVVTQGGSSTRQQSSQRGGYDWPQHRPKYLRAVLRKWNRDTTDVVHELCKIMRVRANLFSFAGTKDKRGVTTQLVTAFKVSAERLKGLSGRLKGVTFGNFSYVDTALGLGDLKGNRFSIILRNISLLDSLENTRQALQTVCASVSQKGFINYFGLQRFGTGRIPTHHVGRALLKQDWKLAVDLVMLPRGGESDDVERARAAYAAAPLEIGMHLNAFPRKLTIERLILETLQKSGATGYLNAIQALPRPTRLLYLHAYQSYVWNAVATERVRKGPLHPIPGDMIFEERAASGTDDEVPCPVHVLLDEEDIQTRRVQFEQLVLPLPGHQVQYPTNYSRDVYTEIMAADDLDPLQMKRKISDFSLPGSYRLLIQMPMDLKWFVSPPLREKQKVLLFINTCFRSGT